MDLTLQSYLNEAVFSSGRGQEATFVSYLQRDDPAKEILDDESSSKQSSSSANEKSDPEDFVSLKHKGSFISYIDDDSDTDPNFDEYSVGSVYNLPRKNETTFSFIFYQYYVIFNAVKVFGGEWM